MRRTLSAIVAAIWIFSSEPSAAQAVDHFDQPKEFEEPPSLTSDRFRYGRTSEETVTITVPRRAKPAPIVIWFPWPRINMATHQDPQWMRSFMFDEGVATARISVSSKASRAFPELIESCARALAEIVRQASRFGYDPERIILAGWGWGAHPAALLATDPIYAGAARLPFQNIRGLLLIEPAGLDLDREHKLASNYVRDQLRKLVRDPAMLPRYSPAAQLAHPNAPVALVLSATKARDRAALDRQLAEVLHANGVSVTFQTVGSASSDLPRSMIGGPAHPENLLIKTFLSQTVR